MWAAVVWMRYCTGRGYCAERRKRLHVQPSFHVFPSSFPHSSFPPSFSPPSLPFDKHPMATTEGQKSAVAVTASSGVGLGAFGDQLCHFRHVLIPSSNWKGIIISPASLAYMRIKWDYVSKCLKHGRYPTDFCSDCGYYHPLKAEEKQWRIFSKICKGQIRILMARAM